MKTDDNNIPKRTVTTDGPEMALPPRRVKQGPSADESVNARNASVQPGMKTKQGDGTVEEIYPTPNKKKRPSTTRSQTRTGRRSVVVRPSTVPTRTASQPSRISRTSFLSTL